MFDARCSAAALGQSRDLGSVAGNLGGQERMDKYSRDGLVVDHQSLFGVFSGGAARFCNAVGYAELAGCLAELFGRYVLYVHEITVESEYLSSEREV